MRKPVEQWYVKGVRPLPPVNKMLGYALLAVGLVLIALSVYLMYAVFTGTVEPPSLVHFSSVRVPTSSGEVEIFRGEDLSQTANLGLWAVLMFFVASAGGRIGGLGVKLVREIRVEVKGED